jgi:hypothetical protein
LRYQQAGLHEQQPTIEEDIEFPKMLFAKQKSTKTSKLKY